MIVAALRDLQWRRKRFAIAVIAAALVFAMSLVMSGLADSFPRETQRLLDLLDGESYLAAEGEAGPFTSAGILTTSQAPDAAPMLFWTAAIQRESEIVQVGLLGLPAQWPLPLHDGRLIERDGEVVVDTTSGFELGDEVTLGPAAYTVVGRTKERTMFGGQSLMVLSIGDAQERLAAGAPVARAFIERETPPSPPPDGLARFTRDEAAEDLGRPLESASQSIGFVRALLWLVAACIIGSVVFLSALERMRDFAIFKATGVKGWQMGMGLALQAVIVAVGASVIAIGLAFVIAPSFPMPVQIPVFAALTLPLVAIVIGLLASVAGLRRTVRADPAQAFGG